MLEKHEQELYGSPGQPGLRTEVAVLATQMNALGAMLVTRFDAFERKVDLALLDRVEKKKHRKHSFLLAAISAGMLFGMLALFMARIVFKVI